MMKLFRTM